MAKAKPIPASRPPREKQVFPLEKTVPPEVCRKQVDFAEIRFRRLVEHMNEAVWVGDRHELTVYANPKFCEIMEYSLEEMLGRPSYDFWTPESVKRVKQVNETDRASGVSSSYEGDLLTKSGKAIPVLLSGTPLPDGGTIGIMTDLREIRRKEAQVESLLNRFDLAVTGSNDGLWYTEVPLDIVGKNKTFSGLKDYCLWYSPRLKEILGCSDREFPDILGSWLDRIHPDDVQKVTTVILSILKTKTSFEIEYRMRHHDGRYRWISTRGGVRPDKAGSTLFVAGSFRDVSENRGMRESLAKRVREAHLLYQANAHMRMVHSIRRVFSDLAKDLATACRETKGVHAYVEFDGKVYSKDMPGTGFVRKVADPIIVRRKKRGSIELRYFLKLRPEESVFNNDRQALLTLGTFIRKHVSSREIMERYHRLVDKSPVGIFILQNGVFKFVNPKFSRMLHLKGTELAGRPFSDFVSHLPNFHRSGKGETAPQNSVRYFSQAKRKGGAELELEIFAQRIDYHGQMAVMGMAQDVTQMKKVSERIRHFNEELQQKVAAKTLDLEKANRRLKSLNELKDEFIAVTSHELRSPLTAIRGYLSFIVQDPKIFEQFPADLRDYMVRVFDNVEVLNNLVNNILDVSRIETGRLELYRKPADIVALVEDVIKNFSFQLGEKKLAVTLSNLLPTPTLVLNIDSIRMRQVLRNILDNAVKYSGHGKRIHFEIAMKGIGVQISVSDEGIGIPKRQIFEVFDKFKQAKNSQSAYKGGAGLGLFIVKKIMELHNGMIWAESQINKGTTFRLQLPLS
jgi:PAS domain S-box-containing protein